MNYDRRSILVGIVALLSGCFSFDRGSEDGDIYLGNVYASNQSEEPHNLDIQMTNDSGPEMETTVDLGPVNSDNSYKKVWDLTDDSITGVLSTSIDEDDNRLDTKDLEGHSGIIDVIVRIEPNQSIGIFYSGEHS